MTLDRARETILEQLQLGSGDSRNAVRLLLGDVQREHGREAGDALLRELDLETTFRLCAGTDSPG